MSVSCTSVVFASCFGSTLFSSIFLDHPVPYSVIGHMYLIGGYSTISFKQRGCAICAVSHYRPEFKVPPNT